MRLQGLFGPLLKASSDQPSLRTPFLKLSLCNDPDYAKTMAGWPPVVASGLVGLIDTGSDLCCVDTALAKRLGLPKGEAINSVAAGNAGVTDTYSAQFYFPEANLVFHAPTMPARSFREAGMLFDIILGMDFLSCFEIRIRAEGNVAEMDYIGR
jgi:hypothetical protein